VNINPRHLSDFQLCHQCLDGELDAIARLQREFAGSVTAYLISKGAHSGEASEVVGSLWADLLVPSEIRGPRLARYDGSCALKTWLNTVALNKLLTRKRTERRWQTLIPARIGADSDESGGEDEGWGATSDETFEAPLIEIMRIAIETAFSSCKPEDFVLLQLRHCDGLKGAELAVMFGCHETAISRRIQSAEDGIAAATLRQVHEKDPWLELKWEDFMELCRSASPSCFGLD
jgi:RNA polymerase sigma factor (sigma-70 family)